MNTANFDAALDQIVKNDPRYHRDAYLFVREALDYTQKTVNKASKGELRQTTGEETKENKVRHVTGQELLAGIRSCALEQFGPMALFLLQEWGVRCCEDFGEIVFNMVETHLLGKTEKDSRADFKGGYDFQEAFREPFLPASKKLAPKVEPTSTEV